MTAAELHKLATDTVLIAKATSNGDRHRYRQLCRINLVLGKPRTRLAPGGPVGRIINTTPNGASVQFDAEEILEWLSTAKRLAL